MSDLVANYKTSHTCNLFKEKVMPESLVFPPVLGLYILS